MSATTTNTIGTRPAVWAALAVALTAGGCGSSSPETTKRPRAEIDDALIRDAQRLIEAIEVERADGLVQEAESRPEAPRLQRDPFGRLAEGADRSHDRTLPPPPLSGPSGMVSLQAIMTFSGRAVAMIDGRALHTGEQLTADGRIWTIADIDQVERSVTLRAADSEETYVATVNTDSM